MRALRPMTQEEREFAEQKHDLVIDFLHRKYLSMDDYYDISAEYNHTVSAGSAKATSVQTRRDVMRSLLPATVEEEA